MKQSLLIRHLRPLLMTVLAVVAGAVPCTSLADTANDTGSSATTSNETDAKKATATFSADGSTLVITASGDITDWIKRSMPTHFTTVIIHPIWGENRLKTA